ncbi:MAG: hypothetical protein COV74_04965 [Candidatus Omnitrophica bacterium CG11_big_fil_rev_8_21_14_0_20_45_26]|uniref:Bacteriophage lambda Replication protein O N-terminal domain-containing protein n=1 Tax=Candidatus Abzuiibacterium crystallinum TaxID=1974748 RepID=A0A2H0LPP6_9BACT|nr:MAG: hypothetical protein COV74_04965 [Candidatus Omnitrophica bacterium CG11_big_fil_rev_8_21_14_0_20_45_26]PIW63612.1 MAG: hypothetical protein COW12_09880 [Candidatus Omnitrophica bacterium CG12_big_fil_rev_8_21_14_0_65_45_16]
MKNKLPSFQFYPGDWKKDPGIQLLTLEERGFWFELLLLMFESEKRGYLLVNGRKIPDEELSRMVGLKGQRAKEILKKLIDYDIASVDPETGALYSRRMVRDEKLRQIRKACGFLGGNPNLVNQNRTTQLNQNPTMRVKQSPTPSSSVSSSSSTSNNKKEAFFLKAFEDFWEAYPSRNGKKILKKQTFLLFKRLKEEEIPDLMTAVHNYSKTDRFPKDPPRFFKDNFWREWLTPERTPENKSVIETPDRTTQKPFASLPDKGFKNLVSDLARAKSV